MDAAFSEFLDDELDRIREQGLFKEEWPILGEQGPAIRVEGREEPVLNFCANNYLGLSGHPELVAAAHRALDDWGYGMSSVRFICGTQALHLELEKRVAEFLGMEDAILYAACFDANGPPVGATVELQALEPGSPSTVTILSLGPVAAVVSLGAGVWIAALGIAGVLLVVGLGRLRTPRPA